MMDRLQYIANTNPQYAEDIQQFLIYNPEFGYMLPYVSLTHRAPHPRNVESAKDCLKYYVCNAGVRADYGEQLAQDVLKGDYSRLGSKLSTIKAIDGMEQPIVSADIDKINIKGIGPGCKTFVKQMYFNDNNDVSYCTDITFRKGLAKIYKRELVSVKEAERLVSGWQGQKYVGSMFVAQAYSYT